MDLDETLKRDNLVNDFLQTIPPLLEQGLADFRTKSPERADEVAHLINSNLADVRIQVELFPQAMLRVYLYCREPVSQGGFEPVQIFAIKFGTVELHMPGSGPAHLN